MCVCVAGNLNIASVKQEDIDDAKVWKCFISNMILEVDAGGSEMRILVSDDTQSEFLLLLFSCLCAENETRFHSSVDLL